MLLAPGIIHPSTAPWPHPSSPCSYDFALQLNTLGPKRIMEFAQDCPNLKLFLHVSTGMLAAPWTAGLIGGCRLSKGSQGLLCRVQDEDEGPPAQC